MLIGEKFKFFLVLTPIHLFLVILSKNLLKFFSTISFQFGLAMAVVKIGGPLTAHTQGSLSRLWHEAADKESMQVAAEALFK
jgi:hypothetical protein